MSNAAPRSDPVAEIEALERELIKIYNDDVAHNVDKVMEYFDDTDEMRMFDVMTPREFTGPQFREHFAALANQYSGVVELMDMKVHADERLGFASSVQRTYGTDPQGKRFDMTFRVTDCLRKTGGKWKIVHEHVSFPIDMSTGRADLQSQP
jgi:ketosteroid isomerase-like protein